VAGSDRGSSALESIRAEYALLRIAIEAADVNAVEREELHDAVQRIEARFGRIETDIQTLRSDVGAIKAIARAGVWLVSAIGGLGTITAALMVVANRGG
jgi:hypothetical protein